VKLIKIAFNDFRRNQIDINELNVCETGALIFLRLECLIFLTIKLPFQRLQDTMENTKCLPFLKGVDIKFYDTARTTSYPRFPL